MFNPTSMCLRNPYGIVSESKAQLEKILTDFGAVCPTTATYGLQFFAPDWLDVGLDEARILEDTMWDELERVDEDILEEIEVNGFDFDNLIYWKWSEPWDE